MKKALILGVVLATVVWTMGLGAFVPVASAATLSAGDLIKASGAAVYFYAADGMRYTFPTQSTYMSWYSNFDGVKTITDDELSAIDLAGNVVIRPGTKLVKITTVPKVFAVQPNGSLAWIETADAAKALYGDNWASMVIDIPDGFWTNYTDSGMVIDGTEFPEGSLVKPEGGSDIYYVNADGSWSMIADETAFNANMWAAAFVVSTTMAVPSAGSDIAAAMDEVIDVSQGGGGGTGTIPASGGTLSVALASSTPGTQMVPKGATGVTLSTFDFTATGGAVTVNSLVAKHSNLGATNEISKLYVYEGDNKLSTGKTISSSTLEATFHNLGLEIASGATTKISLVADFSSTTTTYGYHELALASSSAVTLAAGTVSGSFPVTGNTAQVINTTIGAVDVERSTTSFIRKIGDKEQDLAKFTVYVNNTENAKVEELTVYNSGDDVLSNAVLYRGSEMVSTGVQNGKYFTFTFDTAYAIEKGQSATFTMKGDVAGKNDDSATLYIRYNTDVRVKGDSYGYYLTVDETAGGGAATSYVNEAATTNNQTTVTVEGGKLTVAFNGPQSANFSTNSNDVVLMDFTMTAGDNMTVEAMRVILTADNPGTIAVDYDDLQVLCGGSIVAEWTTPGATNDSPDIWELTSGETYDCQVIVDSTSVLGGGENLTAALADLTGATWTIRDSNSDSVDDVLPSGNISGKAMTSQASSLTINLAGTPASGSTFVPGELDAPIVGWMFAAGDAEDVVVNSLVVTGYMEDTVNGTWVTAELDEGSGVEEILNSIALYEVDGDTLTPVGVAESLAAGSSTVTATFSGLNWSVPAGEDKKLVAYADISTTAPASATADRVALAIAAVGHVDAEYGSGTSLAGSITLTDGNAIANGDLAAVTLYQEITTAGTLEVVADSGRPLANLVLAGATDVEFNKLKFTATNEAFVVEKLQILNDNWGDANVGSDEIAEVVLVYTNSEGNEETATAGFSGAEANFNGLDIAVAKDKSAYVYVRANLNTSAAGADDNVAIGLGLDVSDNFRAVSGNTVLTAPSTGTDAGTLGYVMAVYQSYPEITFASSSPSGNLIPSANTLIAKLSVEAKGTDTNVTFSGTGGATSQLELQLSASGAAAADAPWTVKDGNGTTMDSGTVDLSSGAGVILVDQFGAANTSILEVAPGDTATLYVYLNTNTAVLTTTGNSVQVWMDDATDTDLTFGIDDTGAYAQADLLWRGDLYGGSLIKP